MCAGTQKTVSGSIANSVPAFERRLIGTAVAAAQAAIGGPRIPLDPDLQDAYKRASRTNNGRGAMPSTQMVRQMEIRKEQERRNTATAEMKRLATEREAAMAQQIADSQKLQQEAANQATAQQEKVNSLRAEQATKLGTIRAAGTAVTQSLRILGQAGGKQAPTAAMASKPKAARGARASTASLRMGSTSQGTGSGANLSV